MSSSTAIDDIAGTGGALGDDAEGGRPVRLEDPETVTTVADLVTSHDVGSIHAHLRERWGDLAPVELAPGARAWLVTGYRTIVTMARGQLPVTTATAGWSGHETAAGVSGSHLLRSMTPAVRPTVEQADGNAHDRLRAPIDDMIAGIDEAEVVRIVRARCGELIDGFAGTGVADLAREYITPMPYLTLGTALGFDVDTARQVFVAATRPDTGPAAAAAVHEVSFLLTGQAAARRADGEPVPAGRLARHASYESTAEAALGLLSFVATATRGLQAWLSQTFYLSLTDPRFAGRLAGGQIATDEALDEVLWTASPVNTLAPRVAVEDFVLDDKLIQRGDALLLASGAVGSDPSIRGEGAWDGSGSRAHLTFGAGAHACPAAHLARLIVRTASESLHRRIDPRLALHDDELIWAPDLRFRILERLPVVFRPEQPGLPEPGPYDL